MVNKLLLLLLILLPVSAAAQTGSIQDYCTLGGTSAATQGLNSTNKLQGIIPGCTVTVFFSGTTTQVPGTQIFKDSIGTVLGNPFTANVITSPNSGGWLFFALCSQTYDIMMSGGNPPLSYSNPVTRTAVSPNGCGGGGGSPTVIEVNNTPTSPVSPVNFVDSPTVTWQRTGATIQATSSGAGTVPAWPILSWNGAQSIADQTFAGVFIAPQTATVPSGCTGSNIDTSPSSYTGGAVSYPVASQTDTFQVWDLNTTTNICTITVTNGNHTGTPSGPGETITAGHQLIVVGPHTPDSSYTNFTVVLAATTSGSGGSGGSISLTTSNTTGAATLTGAILNIPVYQGQITLTTTGTSGAATLTGNVLNIPQYTAGGGSIGGSGTTGFLPKFTGSTAIGNSACDDGITTANIFTCAEPGSFGGTTHGVIFSAGTMTSGATGKVVYGVDASVGNAMVNENNGGASRICTAANAATNTGCQPSGSGTNVEINGGAGLATSNQTGIQPYKCADSSGSGTAQVCTPDTAFTLTSGNCFLYTTTTTNSSTGLTLNVNSLGAKSVAVASSTGWTTTLSTSPHSIPANEPMLACYDGTNINMAATGVAPSSGSSGNYINLCSAVSLTNATCSSGTITVTNGSSTFTISSIPGTSLNLELYFSGESSTGPQQVTVQANGDTGSNYDWSYMANNSPANSVGVTVTQTAVDLAAQTGTLAGGGKLTIPNYSGATINKTFLSTGTVISGGTYFTLSAGGNWHGGAAAITSLKFGLTGGNFENTTVTLYGTN